MLSFEININNNQGLRISIQRDFSTARFGVLRCWFWYVYFHVGL